MQETWVWSLIQEVPLEKEMATHSRTLACKIPWTEEPGGYSPWGHKESDTTEQLNQHIAFLEDHLLLLLLSHFSRVRLCATPSLGFSRQEHWSGLPFPSPMHKSKKWKWSHSVMSDSSRLHGLQPTRLLRPWDFPVKHTGVGCHCLLREDHLNNYKMRIKISVESLNINDWQHISGGNLFQKSKVV